MPDQKDPGVQEPTPIPDVAAAPVQDPAPAAAPPPEQEPLNLADLVNWQGANGQSQSVALRDMIEAHDILSAAGGKDGFERLQKLQSGDPELVAELTRKMAQDALGGKLPVEGAPPVGGEGPTITPEQLSVLEQVGGLVPMLNHLKTGFLQQTVQTIVSQEKDPVGNLSYPMLAQMAGAGQVAPVISRLQAMMAELCGDEEPSPEILAQGLALVEQEYTGISQALTGQPSVTPNTPAPAGAVIPSPMSAGQATSAQPAEAPPMFKAGPNGEQTMEVSDEYKKWISDKATEVSAAIEQRAGQL